MLCGGVAACQGMVCVLFTVLSRTLHSEQYTHHNLTCCHNTTQHITMKFLPNFNLI